MEIHHGKHHATYLTNLNKALDAHPAIAAKPIEQVLRAIETVPTDIRQAVINHGGGYFHHTFYWSILGPGKGGLPKGPLADDLSKTFGGFEAFKEQLTRAALGRFGSGWAWLCRDRAGKLIICDTMNQDSPVSKGLTPLLTVDVWEHAYYLKYQNRRADFVAAWWNVVNWDAVTELHAASR
jgi:Fe-Mn family superoxide dismutase